jgi:phosphoglycolate phosphatase-like HAD superfamily hydrolase
MSAVTHRRAAHEVLVLFDIDGTLVRAGDPAHHEAFDEALAAVFGVPATLLGLTLAGRLDHQIAADALAGHGVDRATLDAGLPAFAGSMGAGYERRVGRGDRVARRLPGVPDTLAALAASGVALGVVTGNAEPVGRAKLAAAEIDHLLPVGGWGDQPVERAGLVDTARRAASLHHGRPFAVGAVWVVGDTPLDVSAAHRAGARALAVPTGGATRQVLVDAGPDALLDDLADAEQVLDIVMSPTSRRHRARRSDPRRFDGTDPPDPTPDGAGAGAGAQ